MLFADVEVHLFRSLGGHKDGIKCRTDVSAVADLLCWYVSVSTQAWGTAFHKSFKCCIYKNMKIKKFRILSCLLFCMGVKIGLSEKK